MAYFDGRSHANLAKGDQKGTPWASDGSNVPWRKNPETGEQYFWKYAPDGKLQKVTLSEFLQLPKL